MLDRIKQIMSMEQLSSAQFADEIDIQRSSLSHVLSGRNKPSLDFVMKIKKSFDRISLDWLIFGTGNMFVDEAMPIGVENLTEHSTVNQEDEQFLKFEPEITNEQSDPKIASISKIEEEAPSNYYRKSNRIIIFYPNGTFEEFKKA